MKRTTFALDKNKLITCSNVKRAWGDFHLQASQFLAYFCAPKMSGSS